MWAHRYVAISYVVSRRAAAFDKQGLGFCCCRGQVGQARVFVSSCDDPELEMDSFGLIGFRA